MRKLWLPILLGLLLTAILFPLGIVFSKSGGELFSILFFPFTSILGFVLSNNSGILGVASGYASFFLQYPIYGAILKTALDRGKFYKWLFLLVGLHTLVALACYVIYRQVEN
jgi:hypothetical protein